MRLWRRNESPVGGFYYLLDDGTRVPRSGAETTLDKLVRSARLAMELKGMEVPAYLADLVEDQICQRQPPDRCRYSRKIGDLISVAISTAAGAVDSLAGTKLKAKARGCSSCGKRRVKLNQI